MQIGLIVIFVMLDQCFFFKLQFIVGKVQVKGKKIKDYVWVFKEEFLEYFDLSEMEYMKKMLIDQSWQKILLDILEGMGCLKDF